MGWLASAAGPLVRQVGIRGGGAAPAASSRQLVGRSRHDRLAARLADALHRVGDVAGAERVASKALTHTVEPELLMDLHWILGQSRMMEGQFAEALATPDRALASPVVPARH